jgi:phosphoglycolate phosphatase-like HAD superfamily hydrolase
MEQDGKMKTIIKIKSSWKKLVVFDFDKTLADTEEAVLIRDNGTNRIVDHLTTQTELDNYTLDAEKHYYDFTEFNTVSDLAEPIAPTIELMKRFCLEEDSKVIVLTARHNESRQAISNFLSKQGVDADKVYIRGTSGANLKSGMLHRLLNRFNITESVLIFEDSVENIRNYIRDVEYDNPDISFDYVQVMSKDLVGEELEEAKKHKYPTGEYGTEKYQRSLKRVHPAMKRRLIGLGGNNYSVKGVKKIKDFSRSKSAPPNG